MTTIQGQPRRPFKLGTVQHVDSATGEVVSEERNAAMLLPPAPNVCQDCAVDHPHDQPHNQQSLYYQMAFHATHGRYPTWSDAMAHCTLQVQAAWRTQLVRMMREKRIPVPDDLMDPKPKGR